MMASMPARTKAKQLDPRPTPIEISVADATTDNSSDNQQMNAELRRAFRLTDQQCALPDPVPTSYYSNEFIPIKPINMLLLRLTQFQSLLFSNLAQAPIQSRATQRERSLYHQLIKRQQVSDSALPAGRRSSNQKDSQEPIEKPHDQLTELHWPKRSDRGIVLMLVLEFVLIARGVFIIGSLLSFSSKSVRLCVSRNLNTIDRLIYELDPLPLERVLSESANQTGALQTSAPYSSDSEHCLKGLVDFFSKRYEKFLFWTPNDGMEKYGEFMDEFLFLEQSKPIQMFREEGILFMYIIVSLVLGCGLTGSIVTYYMPYDVIPLLFIYDPTYCAFQIKMRLMQHLNDARQSYVNYWSIFKLNPDFSLTTFGESQSLSSFSSGLGNHVNSGLSTFLTNGQRASFIVNPRNASLQNPLKMALLQRPMGKSIMPANLLSPSNLLPCRATSKSKRLAAARRMQRAIEQVPSLSNELYRDFTPDARSQAFRRVLVLLSPTLSAWASFWLNISLVLTFVIFTSFNTSTVNLNRDLMLFFERSPQWNAAACAAAAQSDQKALVNSTCLDAESRSLELVRTSLINYLAEQFARLSGKAAARQFEDRDQRGQSVAKSLAPTTNPDFYEWTIPESVSILSAVLIILYLNIFFICIGELCFWLFALRIKLKICHLLLRYYSDVLQLDQFRASLSRGRHERYQQKFTTQQQNRLIDLLLMGFNHIGEHIEVPDSVITVNNEQTPTCLMNLGTYQVFRWAFAGNKVRKLMCQQYAKKLILADCRAAESSSSGDKTGFGDQSKSSPQRDIPSKTSKSFSSTSSPEQPASGGGRPSDAFLMSAYLEFRLFLEQIDSCRQSINVITTYWTIHSINILASSMFTRRNRSKIGFLLAGYLLVNMGLLTASVFQSQCTKILPPIHSMLALSFRTSKTIRHLAILWQRSLNDLLGPRSKFFFTVASIRISYASALQFNFGVTSLYLLTVDRFKSFQTN